MYVTFSLQFENLEKSYKPNQYFSQTKRKHKDKTLDEQEYVSNLRQLRQNKWQNNQN